MNNEINALLDDIINNPDKLANATDMESVQKKINPYGVIIPAAKAYANIMLINWQEKYLEKFHLTAIISYIRRLLFEYDGQGKEHIEAFFNRHFLFNPDHHVREAGKLGMDHEAQCKDTKYLQELRDKITTGQPPEPIRALEADIGRLISLAEGTGPKAFPSKASSGQESDTEFIARMKGPNGPLNRLKDGLAMVYSSSIIAAKELKRHQNVMVGLKGNYPALGDEFKDLIGALNSGDTDQMNKAVDLCTKLANTLATDPLKADFDDVVNILSKIRAKLLDTAKGVYLETREIKGKYDDSFLASEAQYEFGSGQSVANAYQFIPPHDVFCHLERYMREHYEQLLLATTALYFENPYTVYSIQLCGTFPSEEKAAEQRNKYRNMFSNETFTVETGIWQHLGPYKQNRDKVDIFNKDVEPFKRMMDYSQANLKLGGEIMKARVKSQKAKSMAEVGRDAGGLDGYIEASGVIERLGSKPILTKEEKEELIKAQRVKEMGEVPADAIQVDVFRTDEEGKFVKSKFYTEAQAPTFMEDRRQLMADKGQLGPKEALDDNLGLSLLEDIKKKRPPGSK
jgi:hypothetical protein